MYRGRYGEQRRTGRQWATGKEHAETEDLRHPRKDIPPRDDEGEVPSRYVKGPRSGIRNRVLAVVHNAGVEDHPPRAMLEVDLVTGARFARHEGGVEVGRRGLECLASVEFRLGVRLGFLQ